MAKVYQITQAGRAELHQWLAGTAPIWEGRSAPLVQVFFAGELSDEELLAICHQLENQFKADLQLYEQLPGQIDEYTRMAQSPREVFCWMLTLESGIKYYQSQLEWIKSVIQRIKNKEIPPD